MEEALLNYLRSYAPLTALIASKSFWMVLPQGYTQPYLLLSVVSSIPNAVFDGETGLTQTRVQFDAYSLVYLTSKNVGRAIQARIGGKRFTNQSIMFRCFKDSERDTFETEATPDKLFRTSLDFLIWHKGV